MPVFPWCRRARTGAWCWKTPTRFVDCCFEHVHQTTDSLCLPRNSTRGHNRLLRPSVSNSKETIMEVLHQRCAGMDISKRDAKVCVRTPGARHNTFVKVVTVSGAMTNDIIALRDYLLTEQVARVVMEATGDYWKPL